MVGYMSGQVYVETILRPVVYPWRGGTIVPEFIYMDDNAPTHRTRRVQDFLKYIPKFLLSTHSPTSIRLKMHETHLRGKLMPGNNLHE